MGGYETIIKWKGKRYLKMQMLHLTIPIGNKLTKKGEKLRDEMVEDIATALFKRAKKKGFIKDDGTNLS